ncbi:hypothetical protein T4A_1422 [Trichinella pseudospiralis]|uniref:Uncharacterized protein n=1 Tax=Trichinella pseudospiralis TaxID=6337 RepID=A0A0V1DSF4_TRIPS|nr:hypothetical protein T4A_1422 [Trichinella pseudospiralis]
MYSAISTEDVTLFLGNWLKKMSSNFSQSCLWMSTLSRLNAKTRFCSEEVFGNITALLRVSNELYNLMPQLQWRCDSSYKHDHNKTHDAPTGLSKSTCAADIQLQ